MGSRRTQLAASLVAWIAGCGARTELRVLPVAAPRLIAPLSTSTVTTWRPTLAWNYDALPRGFAHDGTRVELCRDPACASVMVTFDAPGDHARPPVDLAPGVWFWRARATVGGLVYGANDVVWEFRVTPRDSAVDSNRGTMFDTNRDGLADVISTGSEGCPGTSAPLDQTAEVYLGALGRDVALDAIVRLDAPGTRVGLGFPQPVGDVNGDGFADLVITPNFAAGPGPMQLSLLPGGVDGITLARQSELADARDAPSVSFEFVLPAGDVDRDGYADVVVFAVPDLLLLRGGADGLSALRADPIPVAGAVHNAAGLDDVDGDGFADVGVAIYLADSNRIAYQVFRGGPTGLTTTPVTLLSIPAIDGAMTNFVELHAAGDVNGDGYADLVAHVPFDETLDESSGRLHVYLGSAAGLVAPAAQVLTGGGGAMQQFGFGVAVGGDVNGDGFDDVVATALPYGGARAVLGGAAEFFGSAAGLPATPSQVVPAPDPPLAAIEYVPASVADVDGDGFDDVAIYWCDASPPWFVTPLHRGGPAGLASQPSLVLAP